MIAFARVTTLAVVRITAPEGAILALVLLGVGLGLSTAPSQAAALGAIAADKSGMASAMMSTMRYLGAVAGVAVLGLVLVPGGDLASQHRIACGIFAGSLALAAVAASLLPGRPERLVAMPFGGSLEGVPGRAYGMRGGGCLASVRDAEDGGAGHGGAGHGGGGARGPGPVRSLARGREDSAERASITGDWFARGVLHDAFAGSREVQRGAVPIHGARRCVDVGFANLKRRGARERGHITRAPAARGCCLRGAVVRSRPYGRTAGVDQSFAHRE